MSSLFNVGGCGSCGSLDHLYKECSERVLAPPKLSITLKTPSSWLQTNENWAEVGKSTGSSSKEGSKPRIKLVVTQAGGVTSTYEAEDSSELVDPVVFMENVLPANEPSAQTVDILPNGQDQVLFGAPSSVLKLGDVDIPGTTIKGSISSSQLEPVRDPNQSNAENEEMTMAEDAPSHDPFIPEGKVVDLNPSDYEDEFCNEEEEEDGEIYEQEEDDDLVMEENLMEVEIAPVVEKQGYIFPEEINYEPNQNELFTDADFEAFLGEPLVFEPLPISPNYTSAQSNNSTPSSSSMVNKMDKLVVHHSEVSNSHSGKCKVNDGTIDTSSSVPLRTKKPRFDKE